jgi:hypothetical protein
VGHLSILFLEIGSAAEPRMCIQEVCLMTTTIALTPATRLASFNNNFVNGDVNNAGGAALNLMTY